MDWSRDPYLFEAPETDRQTGRQRERGTAEKGQLLIITTGGAYKGVDR